jgi:hypothetical protein
MEVKLASQKWRQLQNLISPGSEEPAVAVDLETALLGVPPGTVNVTTEKPEIPADENKKAQQAKIRLPVLSGILRNTDIHGRAYATAVIDGQRLKENDKIEGFRIRKILEDGVIVTSNGRSWLISTPGVAYSRVHAPGAEKKNAH